MDGVVNKGCDNAKPDRYPYDDEWSNPGQKFDLYYVDPQLGKRVAKLCEDYDLNIVASSSWRQLFDVPTYRELLTARFLPGHRVVGFTPVLGTGYRADEIRYFVKNSIEPIELYVILDDDSDAAYYSDTGSFFRTNFSEGYTEAVDHKVRRWLDGRVRSSE